MITMETYPIIGEHGDRPFAFEIENAYVRPRTIARLLMTVDGVTDVRTRKPFSKWEDIHVEFRYLSRDYIVWELFGDSSRYWIGPRNVVEGVGDIRDVEDAFKRYRPPFYRELLGDILSLRLIKRLTGRV